MTECDDAFLNLPRKLYQLRHTPTQELIKELAHRGYFLLCSAESQECLYWDGYYCTAGYPTLCPHSNDCKMHENKIEDEDNQNSM